MMMLFIKRISLLTTMHSSTGILRPGNRFNSNGTYNYEAAIVALNSLQSNAAYLREARTRQRYSHEQSYNDNIVKTYNFIERAGIELTKLDQLSIIHVTGTKGKGSTCAYCESILRYHDIKTGFYSSPHLVHVNERIRIDGKSIDQHGFASIFWTIYDRLTKTKSHEHDMPLYFQMVTLMAFKAFIDEKVDVAIVEVGIGGEYDTTNVLRNVPLVGITSIGYDHIDLLGDTIDKIAWQKAGIMKKNCRAFTVPQVPEAMTVLKERSVEKQCTLQVVDGGINDLDYRDPFMPTAIYELNASLAVALAKAWLERNGKKMNNDLIVQGLQNCCWLGRFQIIRTANITYHLDGAHTDDSIKYCLNWFRTVTAHSLNKKVLIYNSLGARNVQNQFNILQTYEFDQIYFVPNKTNHTNSADNTNFNSTDVDQLAKCTSHMNLWLESSPSRHHNVCTKLSISDAVNTLNDGEMYDVLITGSIHLIGCSLQVIQPELTSHGVDNNNYKCETVNCCKLTN